MITVHRDPEMLL